MDMNKGFWTEFIDLYRQLACLWDVSNEDYLNKQKRNASYSILSEKLKEVCPDPDIKLVKRKINSIRSSFRREKRKVQNSKLTGELYVPTLWYYNLLLFTEQSEGNRKRKSNDEWEEDDESTEEIEEVDVKVNVKERKLTTPSASTSFSNPPTFFVNTEETTTPQKNRTFMDDDYKQKSRNSEVVKADPLGEIITPQKNRSSFMDDDYKQKSRNSEVMKIESVEEKRSLDEEYFITGKRIGYQLKYIEESQRIIAEKLISDVIYYAQLGRLTVSAHLQC